MKGGARWLVPWLGLFLAACSRDSTAPFPPRPNADAGTACADYAQQYCERLQSCAPGLLAYSFPGGMAKCTSYYTGTCEISLGAAGTGDSPGLVEQCASAISATSCADVLAAASFPSACLPHGGAVPNDGACIDSWQCASGRCAPRTNDICGTCVAPLDLDSLCTGSECADGLVCSGGYCVLPVAMGGNCYDSAVCPLNGYCHDAICEPLPQDGNACLGDGVFLCDPTQQMLSLCDGLHCGGIDAISEPGDDCGWLSGVQGQGSYGLCDGVCTYPTSSLTGTCVALHNVGEACALTDYCIGSVCVNGTCQQMCNPSNTGSDGGTDAAP
jgi:hypothetical protein